MSRQQWRSALLMFFASFIIVMLVLAIIVQKPAPYTPPSSLFTSSGTPVPLPPELAALAPPLDVQNSGTPFPAADVPGLGDDQDVTRYPGAVLVKRINTDMVHEIHYLTTDQPAAVADFYTSYASTQLGMLKRYNYQLNDDPHGYYLAYDDARNAGSIIVFAISQSLDLPVGGTANPTRITLMVVGQIAIPGRPTPTLLPLFTNSQFRPPNR